MNINEIGTMFSDMLKVEYTAQPNSSLSHRINKKKFNYLKKFENIIHPIRLNLLRILNTNEKITQSNAIKYLKVNPATFHRHMSVLEESCYITSRLELWENRAQKILTIEPFGNYIYQEFVKELTRDI